jgi:hypothetical protein
MLMVMVEGPDAAGSAGSGERLLPWDVTHVNC